MAAKATFFCFILGLHEEIWCQLKLNRKIATIFYYADGFHFGKKCLILGNFDTTIGNNSGKENGAWWIRQKIAAYPTFSGPILKKIGDIWEFFFYFYFFF